MLILFFFLIALLYSSVGFGGGSSYTAVLALAGEGSESIRATSLACNVLVVFIGALASARAQNVPWRWVGLLLLSSIPCVWLGASWKISEVLFLRILAGALFVAGLCLVVPFGKKTSEESRFDLQNHENKKWRAALVLLVLGAGLGFLAGVTGIGGGIYLVPVLHLIRFGREREVAAMGTWFILVNSLVGLGAIAMTRDVSVFSGRIPFLLVSVAVGGLIGSSLLQKVFNPTLIRRWTGVLILVVVVRILFL